MTLVLTNNFLSVPANAQSFVAPVQTGLTLWSFVNSTFVTGSTIKSLTNLAASGAAASVISGAPTIGASFLSFHGGNVTPLDYITTALFDTGQDVTVMAVTRSSDVFTSSATDPKAMGNLSGGGTGMSLGVTGTPSTAPAATVNLNDFNTNGNAASGSITISNMAAWHFIAGTRVASTGVRAIYDVTDGVSNNATHTGTVSISPAAFEIGATPNGQSGICDIAWVGIHQGLALTLTQLQSQRAAVLTYCAGLAAPVTGF